MKLLISVLKEYSLNEITFERESVHITMVRTIVDNDVYIFHNLIYYTGDIDPEMKDRYVELADDFYYRYSVGE